MIPPIALALPFFVLLRFLRVTDTVFGLVLAHTTFNLPFAVWLIMPYFASQPKAFEEAAALDGCKVGSIFRYISFPLALPGILVSAIFCFLLSWNDFLFSLILSGASTKTAPLAINAYMTSDRIEWGPMTASSLLVLIPALILCSFIQKYMNPGMGGGMKG